MFSNNCSVNSIQSDFSKIEARLNQINADSNGKSPPDALDLWVMHERILFLPTSIQRAKLFAQLGHICLSLSKLLRRTDQLSQAISAYEDAVRDDTENVAYREDLRAAESCRM